ncbi:MAG: MFS transporter [Verrucomicrobiaceae bacterium]|nr:MFS transporter [Verrucomicrobiaceae bacterium]
MSTSQRVLVLVTAFLALVFDGVELGGEWFARFTAALMLGAAIGGIALGNLGDRIGRTRAMGVCILFYSVFAALGAYAQDQWQMLALRFLVGFGVGGLWPNGIALVSEIWRALVRAFSSSAICRRRSLSCAGSSSGSCNSTRIAISVFNRFTGKKILAPIARNAT